MKLIGLMPVRNEAWCLGLSARVALMWCDELVVLLHSCTDNSQEIIEEIADSHRSDKIGGRSRVHWIVNNDPQWNEMNHRQQMLDATRACDNPTHIAIIDADEILTGNLLPTSGYSLRLYGVSDAGPRILQLPGHNLRGSLNQYHANGIWGNRWFSVAFADDPKLGWSGDKFHSRDPQGFRLNNYRPIQQGEGGVMHLWGASERRLKAKHALYKLTERLRWPEKKIEDIDSMYSLAIKGDPKNYGFGVPSGWTYKETPAEWWLPYASLIEHLDVDATPWQEQRVWELVKEHGPRMFDGLDLFGVA